MPERVGADAILGAMVSGDLSQWARPDGGRLWLAYPAEDLGRHGVVIGASGSGKTETLLRIAYLAAAVYGWRVVFLDAKGDPATRDRFVAAMRSAGLGRGAVRTFPAEAYDGWRGEPRALINRLIEVTDYSEPYYREIALRVLDLVITAPSGDASPRDSPRSSAELLARLSKPALRAAYRRSPQASEIEELSDREVAGVSNRYRAFFGALGRDRGALDGTWAFEDTAACYVLLEGLALKAEAARLGRFFLEDFAHFAAARKPPTAPALLIVDEFSALESTTDAANLFERLRSFGAAVIVSAQGYAGLGEPADRILDAAQALILHRCAEPERLIARAGTVARLEHTRYLDGGAGASQTTPSRHASVTRRDVWRVRPNDVRQLSAGAAVVISGGKAALVRVEMLPPMAPMLEPIGPAAGPRPATCPGAGVPTQADAEPAAQEGGGDNAGQPSSEPPPPPSQAPATRPQATFYPSPPPAVPGL